ncbi:hypothetical protein M413DRAFT_26897 [Hebeloma cylindrosporum]|uniref:Mediator of RNA polymerase II transcription subunit 13 n=1 Tax=Hebeloma cylindrosporum TaxID=76867 RepID=A0A0C2YPG0_HEBCY|nr:hypothetical protein M413DRAFT_26897 [Hebeloma cylindrosporum h7]
MAHHGHTLLVSRLKLPPLCTISYVLFKGPLDAIELARRSIPSRNTSGSLLESLFESVQLSPEPLLYIFRLHSAPAPVDLFATLHFPGLTRVEFSSFTPPTVSSLLPNSHDRTPLSHFYQAALQEWLPNLPRIYFLRLGIQVHHKVFFSYSSDGSPSHLVLHPTLLPTPFLDIASSLPLPPGTPITLLPYATPAYFLATYNGPTAGLITRFHSSLQGIGPGLWDSISPTFIIAWIKVENKQGEDKGITIIYPTALCLSYIPLSTSRSPLDYIPELPAPLQPSPQVAPAVLSISQNLDSPRSYPPRPSLFSSPTSDSLQLFRGLTLSKANDLRQVATEVGSYVDAVARERERERERLKRERETGASTAASPKLTRTSATTPASVPTPISTDSSVIIPQSYIPPPPPPPPSQLQPAISIQSFYPSPPHTVPNTVPALEGKTSPVDESSHAQPMAIPLSTVPEPASQEPSTTNGAYDLFNMDSYNMGMDLDLDDIGIDFDMNMGSMLTTGSSAGATYAPAQGGSMGMEYEDAFTDEDFSFFDAPTRSAPTSASGPHFPPSNRIPSGGTPAHAHTRSTSSGGNISHLLDTLSGPSQQPMMWTPGIEGFTPRSVDHHDSSAADHLLSPGQTPFANATRHDEEDAMHAPASSTSFTPTPLPNVHLERIANRSSSSSSHPTTAAATNHFEPIPFSKYHRDADGKYAVGKFAFSLPSPPPEEDDEHDNEKEKETLLTKGDVTPTTGQPASWMSRSRPKRWRWRPPILRMRSTPVLDATTTAPWSPTGSGGGAAAGVVDVDGGGGGGWRFRYNAATDPRIGVVRKLIGVKRKAPHALAERNLKRTKSMSWPDDDDWGAASTRRLREGADVQSTVAESEEEEEEDEDEEEEEEDIESPMLSRPTTPPPAYLPLGPTLLHTQFQHAHLLPLSTPLRPPGAAVAPINLSHPTAHPPPSVPTPVSPAATMGAANEKSKSLETAAFAIATEVVENPIWGETWRASAVGAKPTPELWSADYRAVASLLEGVPGLESRVSMEDFFELGTPDVSKPLQPLEAPMLSIGKGEAIIQVQPPALRFWEKLGLNPKSGKKDVSAIAIFEDDGEQGQSHVESWLSNVCSAYQGKHYGTMSLGKSGFCAKDGLFPLRFDSTFRKNLASFLTNLVPPQPTLVIFLILPLTVMSLSSPVLRQILSVSKKVLATYRTNNQFCLQFVPQQHLFFGHDRLSAYDSALDLLCSSVYNRILIPVDRIISRRQRLHRGDEKDNIRRYFMGPSFTLARPLYNKVSYVRAAHTSLDVMDRHTLLHVGYHLTACGRWILACCVDQRGEAHDLGVWLTQSPAAAADHEGDGGGGEVLSDEEYAVKRVWDFAVQFAKRTDVEWRVVFTRLGVMTEPELNAWTAHFAARVVPSREQPPLHHTLACVVPDAPWSVLSMVAPPPSRTTSSGRSPSSSKQQTFFTDITSSTYAVFPKNYIPISVPPSHHDLGLSQSMIPEPSTPAISSPSSPAPQLVPHATPFNPPSTAHSSTTCPELSASLNALPHPITILPPHTSILIRVPHASSTSAITMTQIHLLHTSHSASYTQSLQATSSARVPDNAQLLVDVTRNFHELAVLSRVRFKLDGMGGGNRGLPFHLAAVDAMRVALDRDWERLEGGADL